MNTEKIKQLFEIINSSIGQSGTARSKVNAKLRAMNYSDNEIRTARACLSNSLETISGSQVLEIIDYFNLIVRNKINGNSLVEEKIGNLYSESSSNLSKRIVKHLHKLQEFNNISSVVDEDLNKLIDEIEKVEIITYSTPG